MELGMGAIARGKNRYHSSSPKGAACRIASLPGFPPATAKGTS